MGFSVIRSGKEYYLHVCKGRRNGTIYHFSSNPTDAIDMPDGYKVGFGCKSKIPYIKKIQKLEKTQSSADDIDEWFKNNTV
jgi:hypothetical protein